MMFPQSSRPQVSSIILHFDPYAAILKITSWSQVAAGDPGLTFTFQNKKKGKAWKDNKEEYYISEFPVRKTLKYHTTPFTFQD